MFFSTDKVDFTVENKTKSPKELDQSLLKGSLKRTSTFLESDDDELMYSDDEDDKKDTTKGSTVNNKENNSPLKGNLYFSNISFCNVTNSPVFLNCKNYQFIFCLNSKLSPYCRKKELFISQMK